VPYDPIKAINNGILCMHNYALNLMFGIYNISYRKKYLTKAYDMIHYIYHIIDVVYNSADRMN